MHLIFKPYLLEFKHPFGVSSNMRTHTPTVFVRIEHKGLFGYGEACLPKYLGETTEETLSFLEKTKPIIEKLDFSFSVKDVFDHIDSLSGKHNAAKAAIDIALNDLAGKISGTPFYDKMGFGKSVPVATSATIGIDNAEMIAQKIEEANEFSILKIKAGTEDDKALINLIRQYTNKPLYVDVNQGWTDKEFVLDMLHWLNDKNVLLVEQPMPIAMKKEMAWVTEQSPIPTIADESVKRLKDLEEIKESFTGINIKLMKSAGLSEAVEMVQYARQNNLKVMLGCMAESSCATSAMAQLMKFADYVDLDAPNLIKNDPFKGITYNRGKVILNDLPGIGVELNDPGFFDSL
ncbi:MAG: dipeptide epimerase [Bacteroidia bacterium]